MRIPFIKMHGLGNDFIVLDEKENGKQELSAAIAQRLCDRRFGIGADQILLLKEPKNPDADFRMEILNSDGSQAEMCGNGIRAVSLYWAKKSSGIERLSIETLAGIQTVSILGDQVRVNMGAPVLGAEFSQGEKLNVLDRDFIFHEVHIGNPHAVIFVENLDSIKLEKWGSLIEKHARFPNRTNVEFVQILSPKKIQIRVWERGAGPTLACGSGACAAAVSSIVIKKSQSPLEVSLPGGILRMEWSGDEIFMEGPATEVFRGETSI